MTAHRAPDMSPGEVALELPATFRVADESSIAGQRRYLRATKLRLAMLTLAAGAGSVSWISGGKDYGRLLAAAAFVAALAAEVFILQTRPDRVWFESRSAAESAKTLAWRYAVGGEPFGLGSLTEAEADRLFIKRLNDALQGLVALHPMSASTEALQITKAMRALRAEPLEFRKQAYDLHRVSDQQTWYSAKASWNALRARRWSMVMVSVEALGGIGAIAKSARGLPDIAWLLGLCGASGAAVAAWLQTRQHQSLVCAYSVASHELASIRSLISWQQTEESWAAFVRDAEGAISREHSLWSASRGVWSARLLGAAGPEPRPTAGPES